MAVSYTICVLLLLINRAILQNNQAGDCFKYCLIPGDIFNEDEIVPPQCNDDTCIVLTAFEGKVARPPQISNNLCYKNETSLAVYTPCVPLTIDNINKQTVFWCHLYDEIAKICDYKVNCSYFIAKCSLSWGYGCIPTSATTVSLSPNSSETPSGTTEDEQSTPSEDYTVTLPESTFPTETTTIVDDQFCLNGPCKKNHCYFQGSCYFFYSFWGSSKPLSSSSCSAKESSARGVAVESFEENQYVLSLVEKLDSYDLILTSGALVHGSGIWSSWNLFINETVLKPLLTGNKTGFLFIENKDTIKWIYLNTSAATVLCEYPYNWSYALPQLRLHCISLYDRESCDGSFCCAVDEYNQLWFHCESDGIYARDRCRSDPDNFAIWECRNGSFVSEVPDTRECRCKNGCYGEYNSEEYHACPGEIAYGKCSDGEGYSKWPCTDNGVFDGSSPNNELCCGTQLPCVQQDQFLRVWVGCPFDIVSRLSLCPSDSQRMLAMAHWKCGSSGFETSLPDYSQCYECEGTCSAVDNYGRNWTACWGESAEKPCPLDTTGKSYWLCTNHSKFETPAPDYSQCSSTWINDIEDLISRNMNATSVMKEIHRYVSDDKTGTGVNAVLNVTFSCINLFKSQSTGNGSIYEYDIFTTSYMDVLDDLTSNISSWNNFLETNRDEYAQKIVQMSEHVGFSLLQITNETSLIFSKSYNTLNKMQLMVVYDPVLGNITFPMGSYTNSCSVHINTTLNDVAMFAAVGIAFPFHVGSGIFPTNNISKIMNSPVLSISIADISSGYPSLIENITTQISFKHVEKCRYPEEKIIRRRLHAGENPSPIVGSSACFYYDSTAIPASWVESGCTIIESSADHTVCNCNHLSSFTVLVDIHEYEPDPVLEVLTIVCSALSVISLMVTLIVLLFSRCLKDDRVAMGRNLCFCLLAAHIIFLTVIDRKFFNISDESCRVVAVSLHFVLLSSFFWMFLEAYRLYQLVIVVFNNETRRLHVKYILVAYGFPVVIIVFTESAGTLRGEYAYGRDEVCWLQTDYMWAFDGPVFLLTAINLIIIIIAMRAAVKAKRSIASSGNKEWKVTKKSIILWSKGLASLCILLGVTWLLGLVYFLENHFFAYVFVILNGMQGVLIFMFRCLLNEEVCRAIQKFFDRCVARRNIGAKKSQTKDIDSGKTGSTTLGHSSDVKIIKRPISNAGPWIFKAGSRSRSNKAHQVLPCNDMVRKIQKELKARHSLNQQNGKLNILGDISANNITDVFGARVFPTDLNVPPANSNRFSSSLVASLRSHFIIPEDSESTESFDVHLRKHSVKSD